MQLDDHLRQLLRELGHAINDTVGESDRITGAISNVRSAGYDIVLKLDATIGLAKRDADSARLSNQDRARGLQTPHDFGVLSGDSFIEHRTGGRGPHPSRVHVVLERDRNAVAVWDSRPRLSQP